VEKTRWFRKKSKRMSTEKSNGWKCGHAACLPVQLLGRVLERPSAVVA
jgi:hypothetical protein